MATVSVRIDDRLKSDVEKIADAIGLPLSSVITVLLKRFAVCRGFPFEVTATDSMLNETLFDAAKLQKAVIDAVSDTEHKDPSESFAYFDPKTNSLVNKIS